MGDHTELEREMFMQGVIFTATVPQTYFPLQHLLMLAFQPYLDSWRQDLPQTARA